MAWRGGETGATVERPRIVLFSGGTACRNINIALSRRGADVTRIVPAWDSGGSSKPIRETFNMLPVGDVRQALMTMAHGEGRAGDVVKIFNARLSSALGNEEARSEFAFYAQGAHPLLQRMTPDLRDAILAYLDLFGRSAPDDFDYRNGSIGNFILTGAYLAAGEDINAAVAVFRQLCSIEGRVWPVSVRPDIQLAATLRDGRLISGQHRVTTLDDDQSALGIAAIALGPAGDVVANEVAFEAIEGADAIVFGPGSFFTSILPHLLVDGIIPAIAANRRAPRIFIGNILECAETRGRRLSDLLEIFLATWRRDVERRRGLTHVLSNRELFPFAKTVGKFRYVREGDLEAVCRRERLAWVSGEFEDAWVRGQHDGEEAANALLRIIDNPYGPDEG